MLKKKYLKRMYIEVPYCDICGSEMEHTGVVLSSYPAQYPYRCTNPNCNGCQTFYSNELPNQLKYEFEDDTTGEFGNA